MRKQLNIMNYMNILKQTGLFDNLSQEDINFVLECLQAKRKDYEKGEIILWEDSLMTQAGIILSGKCRYIKSNSAGNKLISSVVGKGGLIGLVSVIETEVRSAVSIQAQEQLSVLFIKLGKVNHRCDESCTRHEVLLQNCLRCMTNKVLNLNERIDCLIRPTIREKILIYLSKYAGENKNYSFMIPLDRSAMAEYINVDRSALSRELSKMKKDGLIDYYKNSFKLL